MRAKERGSDVDKDGFFFELKTWQPSGCAVCNIHVAFCLHRE